MIMYYDTKTYKILVSHFYDGQQFAVFDGVAYTPHGWFGCQLQSIERRKPKIGERRTLSCMSKNYSYEVEIFSVERIGRFRYECNWALPQRTNYEEYGHQIHKMMGHIFNGY